MASSQAFDYFLILNIEATCEENKKLIPQVGCCEIEVHDERFLHSLWESVYNHIVPSDQ